MTSETKRIETLVLTPTTPTERAAYLGGKVTPDGARITVRVQPREQDVPATQAREIYLRTSAEIAALEDALRVMRVRMEAMEHAALTK